MVGRGLGSGNRPHAPGNRTEPALHSKRGNRLLAAPRLRRNHPRRTRHRPRPRLGADVGARCDGRNAWTDQRLQRIGGLGIARRRRADRRAGDPRGARDRRRVELDAVGGNHCHLRTRFRRDLRAAHRCRLDLAWLAVVERVQRIRRAELPPRAAETVVPVGRKDRAGRGRGVFRAAVVCRERVPASDVDAGKPHRRRVRLPMVVDAGDGGNGVCAGATWARADWPGRGRPCGGGVSGHAVDDGGGNARLQRHVSVPRARIGLAADGAGDGLRPTTRRARRARAHAAGVGRVWRKAKLDPLYFACAVGVEPAARRAARVGVRTNGAADGRVAAGAVVGAQPTRLRQPMLPVSQRIVRARAVDARANDGLPRRPRAIGIAHRSPWTLV